MKEWIKRVPLFGEFARKSYHGARGAWERAAVQRMLRGATHEAGPRMARQLAAHHAGEPSAGVEMLAAIEKERAALLARSDELLDGTPVTPECEGTSVAAACRASKPRNAARLMYLLVREYRPQRLIELGTNVGISSAYQAAALEAGGGGGRLLTLEGSPERQKHALELHARIGLRNVDYRLGQFDDTLDAALDEFGPIDFAFIDGHHQHEPTLDYFERIWRRATPGAVFVFDDIRWSEGMHRAWATLREDPRMEFVLDLFSVGICIVGREPAAKPRERFPAVRYALEE